MAHRGGETVERVDFLLCPCVVHWLGNRSIQASLVLFLCHQEHRFKETHWDLCGLAWGKKHFLSVASSAPTGYSGSHFGAAVPVGTRTTKDWAVTIPKEIAAAD